MGIIDGALEKILNSIKKRPVEKFPAIEAPTSEEAPKGFNYGSNKREFFVLVDLCKGWESEFPEIPLPLSEPILFSQPNIFQDGIIVTEYKSGFTRHRLSTLKNLEEYYNKKLIDTKRFSQNMFGTLRVAHRVLFGSFTNEAGSGLSPSNVTLDGEIKDLETFHSKRYGDSPVTDNYYIEDLRLALEALKELCLKVSSDKLLVEKEFEKSLFKGYEIYTNSIMSNDILSKQEIHKLLFGEPAIPSFNSPSGKMTLEIAQKLLESRCW